MADAFLQDWSLVMKFTHLQFVQVVIANNFAISKQGITFCKGTPGDSAQKHHMRSD